VDFELVDSGHADFELEDFGLVDSEVVDFESCLWC